LAAVLLLCSEVKKRCEDGGVPAETTYSTRKSAFVEMAALKNISVSQPLEGAAEKMTLEDQADSDDDDDDDLQAYEMPEEVKFSKVGCSLLFCLKSQAMKHSGMTSKLVAIGIGENV